MSSRITQAALAAVSVVAVVAAGLWGFGNTSNNQPSSQATTPPATAIAQQQPTAAPTYQQPIKASHDYPFPTAAEGPIIASAVLRTKLTKSGKPDPNSKLKVLTKRFPPGTQQAVVEAHLKKWRQRPGVITADWSTEPQPASLMPDDPYWPTPVPGEEKPSSQLSMSSTGLCCSQNGLLDAWPSRVSTAGRNDQVNIAIIDTGMIHPAPQLAGQNETMEAELQSRFLGEWDDETIDDNVGREWDDIPVADRPLSVQEAHGMSMALTATGQADNQTLSAGSAGAGTGVKFGIFRIREHPWQLAGALTVDEALAEISNHNIDATRGIGGHLWSVVNLSLGNPRIATTTDELLTELNRKGILVIAAGGNYREEYLHDANGGDIVPLGKDPISWTAASPHAISVANYGRYHRDQPPADPFQMRLADSTNQTSSTNPFINVAAPGAGMAIFGPGGPAIGLGSSESTAIVSGVVASFVSRKPYSYHCAKRDEAERLPCLIALRALIIGSTTDIAGNQAHPETFLTQGSGLIDVPALHAEAPALPVPARPEFTTATLAVSPTDQRAWRFHVEWKEVPGATGYQVFLNGDGTRQVLPNELDPALQEPTLVGNDWHFPAAWTARRVPLPPIPAAGRTLELEFPAPTPPLDPTYVNRLSLVAFDRTPDGKRQTTSFPVTVSCDRNLQCQIE